MTAAKFLTCISNNGLDYLKNVDEKRGLVLDNSKVKLTKLKWIIDDKEGWLVIGAKIKRGYTAHLEIETMKRLS